MGNIIEVSKLEKSYGSVRAVRGIDFSVDRGTLFAFLGPNGAGKSTTIDMVCTLLAPDSGKVVIDGCILGKDDAASGGQSALCFRIMSWIRSLPCGKIC